MARARVDIEGTPTTVEWIVLAVLALTVPFVVVTGWLGWALKLAVTQRAAVGQLMLRALPVVLLTVLVFFGHDRRGVSHDEHIRAHPADAEGRGRSPGWPRQPPPTR